MCASDRLDAEQGAHWGEMRAHEMVCHVGDQLRVALGDIESRARPIAFRFGDMEVKTTPGLLRFRWYRQTDSPLGAVAEGENQGPARDVDDRAGQLA